MTGQLSLIHDDRIAALEAGQAVVVNLKTDTEIIQWAKARDLFIKVDRGTQWGNPYKIPLDGSREEVIDKYRELLNRGTLMKRVGQLKGRALGCHCAPRACHADLLAEAANR